MGTMAEDSGLPGYPAGTPKAEACSSVFLRRRRDFAGGRRLGPKGERETRGIANETIAPGGRSLRKCRHNRRQYPLAKRQISGKWISNGVPHGDNREGRSTQQLRWVVTQQRSVRRMNEQENKDTYCPRGNSSRNEYSRIKGGCGPNKKVQTIFKSDKAECIAKAVNGKEIAETRRSVDSSWSSKGREGLKDGHLAFGERNVRLSRGAEEHKSAGRVRRDR